MKKLLAFIMGMIFFMSLSTCAPVVKTDLKSLNEEPEKYQGKRVIIITDLAGLYENLTPYLGRKIELSGHVEYKRTKGIYYWNFILKDEDRRTVICYERNYRVRPWLTPVYAVKKAERYNQKITVAGKLQERLRIELDWIEYEGDTIDTNYVPPHIQFPPHRRFLGIPR